MERSSTIAARTQKSPIVAMGGLMGTDAQWDVFALAWEERLRNPLPGKPPLKQFHLAPCRAGGGEFVGYSAPERDHLTYLFRRIIIDFNFVTVACAIDKVAWNDLVFEEVAEQLGDPIEGCFVKCMDTICQILRIYKPGEKVTVFFDEGTRPQLGGHALALRMKGGHPEVEGIAFAPVAKVIALQAADMIAFETYQFAQEWLKDPENPNANPHFREFLRRDLSAGLILHRPIIEEIVARVKSLIR